MSHGPGPVDRVARPAGGPTGGCSTGGNVVVGAEADGDGDGGRPHGRRSGVPQPGGQRDRGGSGGGVLGERGRGRVGDVGRDIGHRAEVGWLGVDLGPRHVGRGLAAEGALAGDGLHQHRAQRVDVRSRAAGLSPGPLGREVVGGADDQPGGGQGLTLARGDAEVHHLGPVAREHEVGRLHVPVGHPGGVGHGQRLRGFGHDGRRFGGRQRSAVESLGQRLSRQQLHDEVGALVGLAVVVDGGEVGVDESGPRAGLPLEAGEHRGIVALVAGDQLHRHSALENGVLGLPDLAHAPDPAAADESVPAPEERVGARRGDVGHGERPTRSGEGSEVSQAEAVGQGLEVVGEERLVVGDHVVGVAEELEGDQAEHRAQGPQEGDRRFRGDGEIEGVGQADAVLGQRPGERRLADGRRRPRGAARPGRRRPGSRGRSCPGARRSRGRGNRRAGRTRGGWPRPRARRPRPVACHRSRADPLPAACSRAAPSRS